MTRNRTTSAIPSGEISFHPHSYADPDGRLFRWEGGLYRALSTDRTPFFTDMLKQGAVSELVERGLLVETRPTRLELDGYGMVVRHRSVPLVAYPHEWCAPMHKDAALMILDLVGALAEFGLTLKDAHPWNVIFDGTSPVWVDLLSIEPLGASGDWPAYSEFCRVCLHPLLLMAAGYERIARGLLWEWQGVLEDEVFALTGRRAPVPRSSAITQRFALVQRFVRQLGLGQPATDAPPSREFLRRVRRAVEQIDVEPRGQPAAVDVGARSGERQSVIGRLLGELGPATVLDAGCGRGAYAVLAAELGGDVVAFDVDSAAVAALYRTARDRSLRVLPLVMDFNRPTPSVGFAGHWSVAATERLKCELVLALGLVPELQRGRLLGLEQIAQGLGLFSSRWLLVDVDLGQRSAFAELLQEQFTSVEVVQHEPDRDLLLCER